MPAGFVEPLGGFVMACFDKLLKDFVDPFSVISHRIFFSADQKDRQVPGYGAVPCIAVGENVGLVATI